MFLYVDTPPKCLFRFLYSYLEVALSKISEKEDISAIISYPPSLLGKAFLLYGDVGILSPSFISVIS